MKKNIKFVTFTILLLLASALSLAGGMHLLASNTSPKTYTPDAFCYDDASSVVAPTAESEMRKKFRSYVQVTDNGKTAQIFSDEQYATLKANRKNGKGVHLTFDEIRFLIDDSIDLYQNYDRIILPNALRDGITTSSHSHYVDGEAPDEDSQWIRTYHGDYSEFKNSTEAGLQYRQMIADIYCILYYRIYMHDIGFVQLASGSASPENTCRIEISDPEGEIDYTDGDWNQVDECLKILMLNTEEEDTPDYRQKLEEVYRWYRIKLDPSTASFYGKPEISSEEANRMVLEHPLLCTPVLHANFPSGSSIAHDLFWGGFDGYRALFVIRQDFSVEHPVTESSAVASRIYPTEELLLQKPQLGSYYEASELLLPPEFGREPIYNAYFYLDCDGTFTKGSTQSDRGTYTIDGDRLILHVTKFGDSFVFYLQENGDYIFCEAESDYTGLCPIKDGSVFQPKPRPTY